MGSITGQRSALGARAWQTEKVRTTCSYCADGCEYLVHTYGGLVTQIQSLVGQGVNQGNLCVRGRFGQGHTAAADRLQQPLLRDAAGILHPVSWEQALERIATEAKALQTKEGTGFAALCGAHVTNEAAYLLQKLTREVMGSQDLDSVDLYKRRAADQALERVLGSLVSQPPRRPRMS